LFGFHFNLDPKKILQEEAFPGKPLLRREMLYAIPPLPLERSLGCLKVFWANPGIQGLVRA